MGALLHQDFTQLKNDYSLFIKHKLDKFTILAVYIDDISMTGDNVLTIHEFKRYLDDIFNINDLGKLSYFLGIEVGYTIQKITLSQSKFIRELLQESWN